MDKSLIMMRFFSLVVLSFFVYLSFTTKVNMIAILLILMAIALLTFIPSLIRKKIRSSKYDLLYLIIFIPLVAVLSVLGYVLGFYTFSLINVLKLLFLILMIILAYLILTQSSKKKKR